MSEHQSKLMGILQKKLISDFKRYADMSIMETKDMILHNALYHAIALQWREFFGYCQDQYDDIETIVSLLDDDNIYEMLVALIIGWREDHDNSITLSLAAFTEMFKEYCRS